VLGDCGGQTDFFPQIMSVAADPCNGIGAEEFNKFYKKNCG
jgi:hypothetical protein